MITGRLPSVSSSPVRLPQSIQQSSVQRPVNQTYNQQNQGNMIPVQLGSAGYVPTSAMLQSQVQPMRSNVSGLAQLGSSNVVQSQPQLNTLYGSLGPQGRQYSIDIQAPIASLPQPQVQGSLPAALGSNIGQQIQSNVAIAGLPRLGSNVQQAQPMISGLGSNVQQNQPNVAIAGLPRLGSNVQQTQPMISGLGSNVLTSNVQQTQPMISSALPRLGSNVQQAQPMISGLPRLGSNVSSQIPGTYQPNITSSIPSTAVSSIPGSTIPRVIPGSTRPSDNVIRSRENSLRTAPTTSINSSPRVQGLSIPVTQRSQGNRTRPTQDIVSNMEIIPLDQSNQEEWLRSLQDFIIRRIAPLVEPDQEKWQYLVNDEAMKVWAPTFTDFSYNPNVGENYESLEKIGDTFSKAAFNQYLHDKFPDIDEVELTEITNYYLSKNQQAEMALSLGLPTMLRTYLDKNTHIFEDLMEALYGALMKIGSDSHSPGVGYLYTYNLTKSLYDGINIDRSLSAGREKTSIKEIFDKLGWGQVIEQWDQAKEEFKVKVPARAIEELRQIQIDIPDGVIGVGQAHSKSAASSRAYKSADEFFTSVGITREWADQQKNARSPNIEEQQLEAQALEKAKSQGIESLDVATVRTTVRDKYYQLIGTDANGRKFVLMTLRSNTPSRANIDIYQAFIRS